MPRVIPTALGVVLILAALGLGAYAYAVSTPQIVLVISPDAGPRSVDTLGAASQVLAAKLAQYTAQAETLRSMATLLIGLGALYTITLGVGHYLSVEAIQKKAEKSAEDLSKLREELSERYPMLEGLADSLETMVERLGNMLAFTEDADIITSYARLSMEDRSELLLLEQNLAIFVHHPSASRHVPGLGKALRGYGRFYLSRIEPLTNPADDVGGLSGRAALMRAKYYLERTVAVEPENVTAVNDLSVVSIQLQEFEAGRKWCSQSLKIQPNQQRVLFNRARIERKTGQLPKAIDSLTAAIAQKNWERQPSARRRCDLHFNRACYRASLIQNDSPPDAAAIDGVFGDLDKSVHAEVAHWFKHDTTEVDGDLYWLAQTHRDRIEELRKRFNEEVAATKYLMP